ncbi:hypothetical protein BH10PLA1_BH10PLA1_20620 [soil metagenome]
MPETFLILLAGGILLAAAVSNPREVTLQWLRLGGITALSACGLAGFFFYRREAVDRHTLHAMLIAATVVAVLGQLAFVQIAWRGTQRFFSAASFVLSVVTATKLIGTADGLPMAMALLALAGVAAMTGLTLMDMLLGHAYLTASKMTIAPFLRLNRGVAIAILLRTLCAVVVTMLVQHWHPVEMLWGIQGLLIGTRWLVGLVVPAVFIYMAHDCIKRRSTQSATGILYVAGVLIFIGEIIALNLVRETGLPF